MCSDLTAITNRNRWQGSIKPILSYVLFLGLFCLLIRLGFWQLSRGHERAKLEQAYSSRQQQILSVKQLMAVSEPSQLTGVTTRLTLNPTSAPLIMLDNQVVKEKVGYLVYQLMQVTPDKPWILVELGFISAYADRSRLPVIEKTTQTTTFSGRVYHTSANPFSHALMAESGDPLRIQNLNYQQLSHLLGHQVLALALQPEHVFKSQDGRVLLKPWRPVAMSSTKNFGYAIQWFAMATALAVIGGIVVYKKAKNAV